MRSSTSGVGKGKDQDQARNSEDKKTRDEPGSVVFSSRRKPVKELPPDLRTRSYRRETEKTGQSSLREGDASRLTSFIPLETLPTTLSLPAVASTATDMTFFSSPSRRNE